jgi:AAA15 family ATPase/GTPase
MLKNWVIVKKVLSLLQRKRNKIMKIKSLNIQNFKAFQNVTIHFNADLNILTGVNNSGKTTILEALALWNECFNKLINQAKRGTTNYLAGDFIFGPSGNRYFDFNEINSVRCPYFEDLFRNRNKKNKIILGVIIENDFNDSIEIIFKISDSVGKYIIERENSANFNYTKFNKFFKNLPEAIDTYYASPVAFIGQEEMFVTDPQIKGAINVRNSSSVIRNRIYRLYQSLKFQQFQSDLSYILFNSTTTSKIIISNKSDIQKDPRVIINYTIGQKDVEKDIALLGSGTLQAIEILLNFYQQSDQNKDLNIILLDEPDSHIHRDIQKRLIEILLKFSTNNQLFITTHNESLIRNTPLNKLFHIESEAKGDVFNMYQKDLSKISIPHFKGIYPSSLSPLIKSIGNDTGLDFINAIESDKIIFVEGDDDARVIYRLLQEYPANQSRKFMFWVLGGVSKIFDKINSYKTFFSDIKNEKTLWEKSFLVFDKDTITDEHIKLISEKITDKLLLPNHVINSYTQEAILFTDFDKLSILLSKYLLENKKVVEVDRIEILQKLQKSYEKIKPLLEDRYSESEIENQWYKFYKGSYVEKTQAMFNLKSPLLENDDVKLTRELKNYYKDVVNKGEYFKLMKKGDVQIALNDALCSLGVMLNIEDDFYELIKCVDKSTWFSEWDYLKNI